MPHPIWFISRSYRTRREAAIDTPDRTFDGHIDEIILWDYIKSADAMERLIERARGV